MEKPKIVDAEFEIVTPRREPIGPYRPKEAAKFYFGRAGRTLIGMGGEMIRWYLGLIIQGIWRAVFFGAIIYGAWGAFLLVRWLIGLAH